MPDTKDKSLTGELYKDQTADILMELITKPTQPKPAQAGSSKAGDNPLDELIVPPSGTPAPAEPRQVRTPLPKQETPQSGFWTRGASQQLQSYSNLGQAMSKDFAAPLLIQGPKQSLVGMGVRKALGAKSPDTGWKPENAIQEFSVQMGQFLADSPGYLAGSALGAPAGAALGGIVGTATLGPGFGTAVGAATGAAIGGGAVSIGLMDMARMAMVQSFEEGSASDANDFWSKTLEQLEALGHGAAVGSILGLSGLGGKLTGSLASTLKVPAKQGSKQVAKLNLGPLVEKGIETTGLAVAGPAVEGRPLEWRDFTSAAAFVAGLSGGRLTKEQALKAVKREYIQNGTEPSDWSTRIARRIAKLNETGVSPDIGTGIGDWNLPRGEYNKNYAKEIKAGVMKSYDQTVREAWANFGENKRDKWVHPSVLADPAFADINPIKKSREVLKFVSDLQKKQKESDIIARAEQTGRAKRADDTSFGLEGYHKSLGAMKGELGAVKWDPTKIPEEMKLTQRDIDWMMETIKRSEKLSFWDTVTARRGLETILMGRADKRPPTAGELFKLSQVFGKDWVAEMNGGRTLWKEAWDLGVNVANVPKSLMASFDLSAPFRQGLLFAARHPRQFFPATKKMLKMFGSQEYYDAAMKEIQGDPLYEYASRTYKTKHGADKSVLDLADLTGSREEYFATPLADRIPGLGAGVRASNRAYAGFLNKLRFDVFKDLWTKAEAAGVDMKKSAEAQETLGNWINTATGRGDLGRLEKVSSELNTVFFSPKLIKARLDVFNPKFWISDLNIKDMHFKEFTADGKPVTPKMKAKMQNFVRAEAAKDVMATTGLMITLLATAAAAGIKVGTNPTSSDFGKMIFGNTRIDIMGGFQPVIRTIYQLGTGERTSSATGKTYKLGEGYGKPTGWDVVLSFFENKLAPIASLGVTALKGKDWRGEPIDWSEELRSRVTPMSMQDLEDLAKEDPAQIPFVLFSLTGGSVGVHEPPKKTYPKFKRK